MLHPVSARTYHYSGVDGPDKPTHWIMLAQTKWDFSVMNNSGPAPGDPGSFYSVFAQAISH